MRGAVPPEERCNGGDPTRAPMSRHVHHEVDGGSELGSDGLGRHPRQRAERLEPGQDVVRGVRVDRAAAAVNACRERQ